MTRRKPVFLLLLPIFFVLHGFTRNYKAVAAVDALLLSLFYIGIAIAIAWVGWLFYRDLTKASLLAFFLLLYHFFFGSVHDALKTGFSHGFISQYRFILPASIIMLVIIIVWLKKRKRSLFTLATYFNILLLVLLLIDIGWLTSKIILAGNKRQGNVNLESFTVCDTCRKPDIYFILLDQYAGHSALKEVFDFDNSHFENELRQRGFHITAESSSNYNLTPFSMASTLNMGYLGEEMGVKKKLNVGYSYQVIRNSFALQFLNVHGYHFYNNSVFDFPGQPAHKYGAFLPYGTKLITYQTFTSRIARDIRAGILEGKLPFKEERKKIAYEYLHFNDTIFQLTRNIAVEKSNAPKFVYSHFMIPHYPYYFDSKGNPVELEKLSGFRNTNSTDYIEYLQYGNQKILRLVDDIMTASATPPIIILLADHGFRHPGKKTDRKYDFVNLNAIFLPGKNYSGFYQGMTNVNQFRVVFNTSFGQQFPLLKDSTIDLWD